MSYVDKLDDTYNLLSQLDKILMKETNNALIKKHLLSVADDLAKYKDMYENNIKLETNEIKLKITHVLDIINAIEINVKNKLKITERYNSYLNS